MDISASKVRDTILIDDFYTPGGELLVDESTGKPVSIEVYGKHTDVFRKALGKQVRAEQIRKGVGKKPKKDEPISEDYLIENFVAGVGVLAACTVSISGFYDNCQPLECTPDNLTAIYKALPYVQERVEQDMGALDLFLPKA